MTTTTATTFSAAAIERIRKCLYLEAALFDRSMRMTSRSTIMRSVHQGGEAARGGSGGCHGRRRRLIIAKMMLLEDLFVQNYANFWRILLFLVTVWLILC